MTAGGWIRRFGRDTRGTAAVEFGGVGLLLMVAVMNGADVGRYGYQTSEVNAAAQAGAQAAAVACDLAHTPATLNCPELNQAVSTAIQSSPLGSDVTLKGGLAEAYYCLDNSGALKRVAAANSKPADCSAVNNTAAVPTLYIQVPVTYTFQPLFPGMTLAQSFAPTIERTAWMRMA